MTAVTPYLSPMIRPTSAPCAATATVIAGADGAATGCFGWETGFAAGIGALSRTAVDRGMRGLDEGIAAVGAAADFCGTAFPGLNGSPVDGQRTSFTSCGRPQCAHLTNR